MAVVTMEARPPVAERTHRVRARGVLRQERVGRGLFTQLMLVCAAPIVTMVVIVALVLLGSQLMGVRVKQRKMRRSCRIRFRRHSSR